MAAELEPQGAFRATRARRSSVPSSADAAGLRGSGGGAGRSETAAGTIPFFSTVTGERCAGESCDAAPLGPRHSRSRCSLRRRSMRWRISASTCGWKSARIPRSCIPIQECLTARGAKGIVLSSARREREHESVLETAMDLHRAGVALDFAAMTPSRRLLSLPAYAWDKSRWWNESSDWREGRLAPGGRGCSISACRAPCRPGSRGSMPGTWPS